MRKPNTARQLATLLLSGGILASCSKAPRDAEVKSGPDSPVLAEVAGTVITVRDLLDEVERRQTRRQPVPSKEALLEAMVERAALIHRAKEAGLEQDPEIRRALDSLLVTELRQKELQAKLDAVEVSEDEMRAAYAERAASFMTPAKAQLAILHLAVDKAATDVKRGETRARMTEAREKALAAPAPGGRGPATGGFGELAVAYSDDQVSRYRGGNAGWFAAGQSGTRWPAEVLAAGHALAVGEMSEVLEIRGDFYLVRKTEEQPETTTTFEDALPAIHQQVLTAKREVVEKAFLEESGRLAGVKLMPDALAGVEMPVVPPPSEPKPPTFSGVSP